jgi:hypothetical protein
MKAKALRIGVHAVLMTLAMLYGMLITKFQLPPYQLLKATYTFLTPKEHLETQKEYLETQKEHLETQKEYLETDVAKLISITQPEDVSRVRRKLITFLWGKPELPSSMPTEKVEGFTDERYDDISSLRRIDKLGIVMEFGLESTVYHFFPNTANNKVVLYHQGHRGDFYKSKEQIKGFIDSGYSVVAFSMPLLGLNNQPTVPLPRLGSVKLTAHDTMKFLSPENGHPVKYFIEPVVTVLNYLENNFDYSTVSMVGISGGGWTTTLAAAVDARIETSFPVAGTYPIYLRSNSQRDWGDYEQGTPELYKTVNYLDIYMLGSYGANRKQLQIINKYDPCCFAGTKWETYKDTVRARAHALGAGEFDLFLDDSHKQHVISKVAMSRILFELGSTN